MAYTAERKLAREIHAQVMREFEQRIKASDLAHYYNTFKSAITPEISNAESAANIVVNNALEARHMNLTAPVNLLAPKEMEYAFRVLISNDIYEGVDRPTYYCFEAVFSDWTIPPN